MTGKQTMADAQGRNMPEQAPDFAKLLEQYGGPIRFAGKGDGLYERHLVFDNVADPAEPGRRQQYEALARAMRDILAQRWRRTDATYDRENPKRVYYLSLEFLIGRSLANNVLNLRLDPVVRSIVEEARPGLAGRSRGRARRRPRQWRPRAPRRLLSRFDGHPAAPGDGLRAALRVRHFPPDHRGRLAARASRQLAARSRSVGGGAAAGGGRNQAGLLVRRA